MKSKNWQETKNMSEAELKAKLGDLQDKLFKLKFRHTTAPVKNPLEIRSIRRNIARIKTLLAQKKESK
ncbi:50S ribosomal protein L29 [Endomicrobium proavitum]|uniref:Large ribosomal subunit protein uL29 n=1 Tax=Endomicrobium proavitum TaxID=1408281 RepID=A0A0G3WLA9_9BACT|nr:50S ribosomal protein L29 [Endomicrobium proavitum]AKL98680.1 50S ribosomal protein L29 [Endomicrobium proavitum]